MVVLENYNDGMERLIDYIIQTHSRIYGEKKKQKNRRLRERIAKDGLTPLVGEALIQMSKDIHEDSEQIKL